VSRYVFRMFTDEWRQWSPAIAVVAVVTTLVGLCVHQFAWTSAPAFATAVADAGASLREFRILSITIYTVVALVAWVALTIVGRASVMATHRTYALWSLMGASPGTVFGSSLLVLGVVSLCGALAGALLSSVLAVWAVPAFTTAVSPEVALPGFALRPWSPAVTIALGALTSVIGGVLPALDAALVPPGAALRPPETGSRRALPKAVRIGTGVVFLLVASGLVAASAFAEELGVTGPATMFTLSVDAGGSALLAVHLLCPEIARLVLLVLHAVHARSGLVVPALGTRAAADRVQISSTTTAPLAAGLGGIGMLLCAVDSVVAMTRALQPGSRADLTDVWAIVAVLAVSMLATSAAVVALSAKGRGQEIALLQAAGMRRAQIVGLLVSESLALSLTAALSAAVPVATTGLVCWFVSRATLSAGGVVAWPVPAMVLGLIGSWLALSLILLVPTQARFRTSPGVRLREQSA
jgi:putative ABC transport system permease protein